MKIEVVNIQRKDFPFLATVDATFGATVDEYPSQQMRDWCYSAFGDNWNVGIWSWGFKTAADRTLFILRWAT
jgi:hypothetical protein